jgi:hypothetical protein
MLHRDALQGSIPLCLAVLLNLQCSVRHCTISALHCRCRVPERVTYLREVLDSDPSRLKEVFLESLKLESLRFALVDEIQLSRDRRSSVVGGGGGKYLSCRYTRRLHVVLRMPCFVSSCLCCLSVSRGDLHPLLWC